MAHIGRDGFHINSCAPHPSDGSVPELLVAQPLEASFSRSPEKLQTNIRLSSGRLREYKVARFPPIRTNGPENVVRGSAERDSPYARLPVQLWSVLNVEMICIDVAPSETREFASPQSGQQSEPDNYSQPIR